MRQYDIIQKFLFEGSDIRGELVHLHTCVQALTTRHPYPEKVLTILSQALSAVSLLSGTIKFEGALILQTQSDGAIHLLVAQADEKRHIRGLAKWDDARLNEENLLGKGHLAITMIPNNNKDKRYQGVVELKNDILSLALQDYFEQSEQLPTKLWLVGNDSKSAGILLQVLPNHRASDWTYWEHLNALTDTITQKELLTLDNQEILHRLFHEEDIRLFEASPVIFKCTCSKEKMEQALLTYGQAAIDEILKANQVVDVTCEFCNQQYSFDRIDVAQLFSKPT